MIPLLKARRKTRQIEVKVEVKVSKQCSNVLENNIYVQSCLPIHLTFALDSIVLPPLIKSFQGSIKKEHNTQLSKATALVVRRARDTFLRRFSLALVLAIAIRIFLC